MDSTSAVLIAAGIGCLGLAAVIAPKLRPREGRPVSPWLKTETRETASALTLFVVFLAGLALLAKGFLA